VLTTSGILGPVAGVDRTQEEDQMARTVVLGTLATGAPMGQQVYEEEVAARTPTLAAPDLAVARLVARSLRSPLAGTVRLPTWVLGPAPAAVRRAVGAGLYGRAALVHRMSLSLPPARVPEVVTVHDTVAWRFADESTPEPHAAAETRRAAAVISPSAYAAADAADRLGLERVLVVHNGVDERFFTATPLSTEERAGLGLTGDYVLHAGGMSLRKNPEGLAAAWPKVRSVHPDLSLVLSGPPAGRRKELFADLPGTALVGRVPEELLPRLMAGARAVVVPSVYEGFGLPALEALACGVPVVAVDRSSLPEVCGDAATLVEPDGDSIAQGILHALSDDPRVAAGVAAGRLRARSFSWEASAAAHVRIWSDVLAGRTPTQPPLGA
jgi:glycosyltransferase involved in cell wall biosynthesis